MSTKGYQSARYAELRWPELYQFIAGHHHQDRDLFHSSEEEAVDDAISFRTIEQLKQVAREWCDWNATAGAADDIRSAVTALGVADGFATANDARKFMNMVCEKTLVAIRSEEESWKP